MESFVTSLIKSPFRLLCFALTLYVACHSFVVGMFLLIVGASYAYPRIVRPANGMSAPKGADLPPLGHACHAVADREEKSYPRSAIVVSFPTSTASRAKPRV